MATLHHTPYQYRDFASHPTDTPVFHAVEQKLHAGWLFDPRLPAPGPAISRPGRRRRYAKTAARHSPARRAAGTREGLPG